MSRWFTADVTPDEERAIAAFMQRLAKSPAPEAPVLASLGAIWWKAQLLRRWDEQREAARPLAIMEPIQFIAGLTAAALMFLWAAPSLIQALAQVVRSVRPIV